MDQWRSIRYAAGVANLLLAQVAAVKYEGGLYKLDGHIRSLLWHNGRLERPAQVYVTTYLARSKEEFFSLYRISHATTGQTNPAYNQIVSAYQACGLVLKSTRLRTGFIRDALDIALRGAARPNQGKDTPPIDVSKAVSVFRDELAMIDSINPTAKHFYTGILSAALICLSLWPEQIEFFRRIVEFEGERTKTKMDPVEAVLRMSSRLENIKAASTQEDLCRRTVRAFLAYMNGKESDEYWFERKPRAYNILPLIQEMKAKKGIDADPDL